MSRVLPTPQFPPAVEAARAAYYRAGDKYLAVCAAAEVGEADGLDIADAWDAYLTTVDSLSNVTERWLKGTLATDRLDQLIDDIDAADQTNMMRNP